MDEPVLVHFGDTKTAFQSKSTPRLRRSYRLFRLLNLRALSKVGQDMLRWAFELGLPVKAPVKETLFRHFCGGETLEECIDLLEHQSKFNMHAVLDYSVENKKTDQEIEAALTELLRTLDFASGNEWVPFGVFKTTAIAPAFLLEKKSSGVPLSNLEQQEWQKVEKRFERLCQQAYDCKVPIFVDAEETWLQQAIDDLTMQMMERFNREQPIIFTTLQLYRTDRLDFLREQTAVAREKGFFLGVKMVRGAYMEKERKRAEQDGHTSPIHETKHRTDEAFNQALQFCIENRNLIHLCCASHNEYSCQVLVQLMNEAGMAPDDERVWFSQLYGMCDHISYNLAQLGYNVAKYIPYGPVEWVMPYLIRRAEENSSVTGQSQRELQLIKQELERREAEMRQR